MKTSNRGMLRFIATFKFLKVALLIVTGVGIIKLLHKDLACALEHWITMLGLNPGNQFIEAALTKASNLTPNKVKLLGAGSFIYAGLFLTEGVGLWLARRWGEWLAVIITSSLVPVEVYEIFRHLSFIKILMLITNLAIVAYLVYRIRKDDRNPGDPKAAKEIRESIEGKAGQTAEAPGDNEPVKIRVVYNHEEKSSPPKPDSVADLGPDQDKGTK